jgi:hypothetical protein
VGGELRKLRKVFLSGVELLKLRGGPDRIRSKVHGLHFFLHLENGRQGLSLAAVWLIRVDVECLHLEINLFASHTSIETTLRIIVGKFTFRLKTLVVVDFDRSHSLY